MHDLFDLLSDPLSDPPQIEILDIGAAPSDEVLTYAELIKSGRARLTGFEPDLEQCNKLMRTYGDPHRFFPYFVGTGEVSTFYETNWSLTGSLYEPNTPLLEKFFELAELMTLCDTYPVETVRLDDIEEIEDVEGNGVLVYPNPLSDNILNISLKESMTRGSVSLYNPQGRMINAINAESDLVLMDMAGCPPGNVFFEG
ncbi:MAG: hypothetical protein HC818_07985 [Synechococcaceae cyanobacterium RM1_1_27]|nr:hypothetical protein [Synechococcaceae cyanobacterium RM1_1_27]